MGEKMKRVQPPAEKSECQKKVVKRPPSPPKRHQRPAFDNSLYRPKEKNRLKSITTATNTTKPEPDLKTEADVKLPPCCVDWWASGGSSVVQPSNNRKAKDDACYTHKKGYTNRRDKKICGQQPPCNHPRYPPCVPDMCFSVQCYRTGPDSEMKCCFKEPYEPQTRKVFCHRVCNNSGDDGDGGEGGVLACKPTSNNNEYQFT